MNRFQATILAVLLSSSFATAADRLEGDTLVRSLGILDGSLVLFQNPTGESARALVLCVLDASAGKELLSEARMGGIMLSAGSRIVFKIDQSAYFSDGTSHGARLMKIECGF